MALSHVQLGKNGITSNFIISLKSHFENHDTVKISVLKNASRNKEEIKKMTEEILDALGKNYTARVLGFTISVKRWRRIVRQ